MKIEGSGFNSLGDIRNGRVLGVAEVRKIVGAIAPISRDVNSTTLLFGLSATCHNLSLREIQPTDYARGRRELLQDASDIAWAIASIAEKADAPELLRAFVAILQNLTDPDAVNPITRSE